MKMNNSGSVQHKMMSEENLIFESVLPKEERIYPNSDLATMFETEDGVCSNGEAENKIKIKEEALVIDGLQNEDAGSSLNTMEINNNGNVCGIFSTVDIKADPWWQEGASPEIKFHPEASSISECQVYKETKDGANEDFTATETTRSHTETVSSGCSAAYVFADSEEKDISTCGKNNSEFVGTNIHVSDMVETSYRENTVEYHVTDAPHEYKQSEKHDKYTDTTLSLQNSLEPHIAIHNQLGDLKRDMIPEGKRTHQCDVCERSFTKLGSLENHILIHKCKMPYTCDICQKSFSKIANLKKHVLIHEAKRPYKCHICERSFTQKENLKRHVLLHEGERKYKCNVCEKSFLWKVDLKVHFLIHEGKMPYKCEVCEKSYIEKGDLERHILMHESKRPCQCSVCVKSFSWTEKLKRHVLHHEGKKAYSCYVCKQSFSEMRDLKQHILVHEGKRSYGCEVCEKSFSGIRSLKQHSLIHEGKKPFKCHICEKSFTQKGNLNRHLLVHEGKKVVLV